MLAMMMMKAGELFRWPVADEGRKEDAADAPVAIA